MSYICLARDDAPSSLNILGLIQGICVDCLINERSPLPYSDSEGSERWDKPKLIPVLFSLVGCPKTSHPVGVPTPNTRLFKGTGSHLMTHTNSLGHAPHRICRLIVRIRLIIDEFAFTTSVVNL